MGIWGFSCGVPIILYRIPRSIVTDDRCFERGGVYKTLLKSSICYYPDLGVSVSDQKGAALSGLYFGGTKAVTVAEFLSAYLVELRQ